MLKKKKSENKHDLQYQTYVEMAYSPSMYLVLFQKFFFVTMDLDKTTLPKNILCEMWLFFGVVLSLFIHPWLIFVLHITLYYTYCLIKGMC